MSIELVEAYKHKKEVGLLFSEYTDMLIEKDSNFKKYLEIQNYDSELEHLEDKYGRPFGRLYLVYYNRELAGCIGIRKIDDLNCEMKRLYVRPQFRGKHIGDFLIKHIIAEAKEIGYEYMLLDTLPFLKAAICMYKKYGFYEIQSYNNSPMDTSIYMKLNLRRHKMTAEEMWKQFAKEKGINDTYEAWAFCGGGEIGDELARLVLEGTKCQWYHLMKFQNVTLI